MSFAWAKAYLPRSLYGRAALILLVPVVTLQLLVSVIFIQRHFEGVTEQMTRNVALELRYLLYLAGRAPDASEALAAIRTVAVPLAYHVELPAEPPSVDSRLFYDFSGLQMMETIRAEVANVRAVDLSSSDREVRVWIDTAHGVLSVTFGRYRVSASNPHQLLVWLGLTGTLLTIIAYVFLRNQLRPIMRLAHASEAFGKGRSESYTPSGAVEVRAAGQAFLGMRARIERHIEQRTMMLSGVSHDMRTPLTRLRLGLSMLDDTDESKALMRDVEEMERLLEEFLAFSRDDSLDDLEAVDVQTLVHDVVRKFANAGHAAELVEPGEGGTAMLRPLAVSRAIENLIDNAIQYGERCEVRIAMTRGAARISVEDDGPGIPEEDRAVALRPFMRLDNARNQDRGSGVGLGLAIASDIARRHGGSLSLEESQNLGGLRADLVLAR